MSENLPSGSISTSPGVLILKDLVPDHSGLMNELLQGISWDTRMKARLTASFGRAYNYSGISYPECEMLPSLMVVVEKLFARTGHRPTNCLINYYPDGNSSLGFHCDIIDDLQEGSDILVISLGSTRDIVFRSTQTRERTVSFALPGGSLLQMDQETQNYWMHAIPKQPCTGPRMSLTFRCML